MEWSKEKTLKLIELLQVNANLWNTSLCDTRRDKQKRKEELRAISDILGISISDITKKIQHLRTQYNRESSREARANAEDPNDRYVSNWYAYEYLHFMKASSKPFRVLLSEEQSEMNSSLQSQCECSLMECKLTTLSPKPKVARTDSMQPSKQDGHLQSPKPRDEFSVFGEYIANELRSLKGEKNLLVAKKKIQDVIFEVKMDMINDCRTDPSSTTPVYSHLTQASHTALQNGKLYATPTTTQIEQLSTTHTPTSGISEIIVNVPCHYTNFKVDNQ